MKRALIALCALSAGCNWIDDFGGFYVRDAGPPVDGGRPVDGGHGGMDAGHCPGGGSPQSFYRDGDGDGYGTGAAMVVCTMPTGFVAQDGDCDDSMMGVHPGVTETCDAIDQDCDTAIDEGLLVQIGTPILVASNTGAALGVGASVIAYDDGVAVIYKKETENVVRASFYDLTGAVVRADDFIAGRVSGGTGPDVSFPSAARFTSDGIDRVVVFWIQPDAIGAKVCTATDCGAGFLAVETDTTGFREMHALQLEDRLIVLFKTATGAQVFSYDPLSNAASALVPLPATAMDATFSLATVEGAPSYSLVGRNEQSLFDSPDAGMPMLPDGGTLVFSGSSVLRVHGVSSLTFDEVADTVTVDFMAQCAALGDPLCMGLSLPSGQGRAGAQSLVITETLVAGDESGLRDTVGCATPATPAADGTLTRGECSPTAPLFSFVDTRGPIATVLYVSGSLWLVRDLALAPGTTGGTAVQLTGLDPLLPGGSNILSVRGNHGAVLGNADTPSLFDVSFVRLGCE